MKQVSHMGNETHTVTFTHTHKHARTHLTVKYELQHNVLRGTFKISRQEFSSLCVRCMCHVFIQACISVVCWPLWLATPPQWLSCSVGWFLAGCAQLKVVRTGCSTGLASQDTDRTSHIQYIHVGIGTVYENEQFGTNSEHVCTICFFIFFFLNFVSRQRCVTGSQL